MKTIFTYFLVFLLLLLERVCCFPNDLVPNLVVSEEEAMKLPVFIGLGFDDNELESLEVQEIKLIDGKILVGSRNAVFVLSQSSFGQATGSIAYDEVQFWKPSNAILCQKKIASVEKCQNYIRVITQLANKQLFICGTNAREPRCRTYKWHRSRFSGSYENATSGERFISPYDDTASLAYNQYEGYVVSATRVIVRNSNTIARIAVSETGRNAPSSSPFIVNSNSPLPNLKTTRDSDWLNDPHFIKMVDAGEKMFIFFREEALERSAVDEKVVFSRVAQVCKQDVGGSNRFLDRTWSSYFKARLNCSIPGKRPFYFNELQHVTDVITIGSEPMVFATFTTPPNSIVGSAVCAFTMISIETAMNGNFLKQNPEGSCGWNAVNSPESASLTSCGDGKNDETLRFIQNHPFMQEAVQPLTSSPLFTITESKTALSAIAVETNPQQNDTVVVYAGTHDGRLLKILTKFNATSRFEHKTIFSEEWHAFQPSECNKTSDFSSNGIDALEKNELKKIRHILVLSDHIVVAFKHCVISVPKKECWRYKCKRSCAQSGNPYCGWHGDYCARVSPDNEDDIEQDFFQEKIYNQTCPENDGANIGQFCVNTLGFVFPLVISLVVVFSVLLFGFLCYVQSKKRNSGFLCINKNRSERESERSASSCGNRSKSHRALLVRHTKNDPLRVTVEPTSPIEPFVAGERPIIGSPQPLNNLNMNSNNQNGQERRSFGEALGVNDCENIVPLGGSKERQFQTRPIDKTPRFAKSNEKEHLVLSLGETSVSMDYGSTMPLASKENTKQLSESRVLANPNYLPVTPHVLRNTNALKQNPGSRQLNPGMKSPGLTTFVPDPPKNERRKLIPNHINNFDLSFPRPPSYVLNEFKSCESAKSNRDEPPPKSGLYSVNAGSAPKDEWTASNSTSFSKLLSSLSPQDVHVNSYPGSTSSGFVSASPQDQIKDQTSSRREFIVAKGILSAQSSLSSPNNRKNRRKKKTKSKDLKELGINTKTGSTSSFDPTSGASGTSSNSTLESKKKKKRLIFPNPEFLLSSDEDDAYNQQPRPSFAEGLTPYEGKKTKMFRPAKHKKAPKAHEESFRSPAFDEEPELPIVEGWEEIEYNRRYSTLFSKNGSQYFDDSCINFPYSAKANESFNFYTMRPKGRMRQKMPKLRNTGKEWNRNNNPLPVPTPEIPDVL